MSSFKTKDFFDSIAVNYSKRYTSADHRRIFFNNRINFSLQDEDIADKIILDIGAGSGILYHKIKHLVSDYKAWDISEVIMKQGGIPPECYRVIKNSLQEVVANEKYDYIFMLGVTTYLSDAQLSEYLAQIRACCHSQTRIIISYTLDNFIHRSWRIFLKKVYSIFLQAFLKRKDLLITSDIKFSHHSPLNCIFISREFECYDCNYQNIFLPPFDRLMPRSILLIIDRLVNKILGQKLIRFLASDLTVKYRYIK